MIKELIKVIFFTILICSCEKSKKKVIEILVPKKEKIIKEFGFTLNDFNVKKDTVKRGESFGLILENENLFYPKIYNIVNEVKKVFDIRKINT